MIFLYTVLSSPLAAAAPASLANSLAKALLARPFEHSSLSLYLWSFTFLLHIQSVWGTLHLVACLWLFSSNKFSSGDYDHCHRSFLAQRPKPEEVSLESPCIKTYIMNVKFIYQKNLDLIKLGPLSSIGSCDRRVGIGR